MCRNLLPEFCPTRNRLSSPPTAWCNASKVFRRTRVASVNFWMSSVTSPTEAICLPSTVRSKQVELEKVATDSRWLQRKCAVWRSVLPAQWRTSKSSSLTFVNQVPLQSWQRKRVVVSHGPRQKLLAASLSSPNNSEAVPNKSPKASEE